MPRHYAGSSLGSLHAQIVKDLLESPEHTPSPRGSRVHEVLASTISLSDPRNRLILSPARAVNYAFGAGELCWYLRGDSDLQTMVYYNKRMEAFSDDGKTLRSAYGARIFNSIHGEPGQFELAAEELVSDPDSRRAVIHINDREDLMVARTVGTKDVPCTMSLQFFIRDGALHLHTLMRSNDVIWGLPYDIFSFTMIQEAMLGKLMLEGLDVKLGSYYHTAGSLHLYDRHVEMAARISSEEIPPASPMGPMGYDAFELLLSWEEDIRTGIHDDDALMILPTDGSIGFLCKHLMTHRRKRLAELAKEKDAR